LILIPTKWKLYAALVGAVLAAFAWAYFVGRRDEAAEAKAERLKKQLEAVRKRREVEQDVEGQKPFHSTPKIL